MFSGRVEARYSAPSGTTLSISSGALTSAVSVTWPAANYFHTSAGGVSSGLTALQTAINASVQGYPDNAQSFASALGYGSSTAGSGWLFNITSGNDAGAFGGVTMTASGTPVYYPDGPRGGIDRAVAFDAAAEAFSAGDTYDVTATDDLIIAWVGYLSANPAATRALITKYTTNGWYVQVLSTGVLQYGGDAIGPVGSWLINSGVTVPIGAWYVGIACLDRSTGKARIGIRTLSGSTTTVSSEATATAANISNAANLTIGRRADAGTDACTEAYYAGLYIQTGTGIATGLSANLSTALANFASAVSSSFSVSMSTSTGLVTLSNSFWPCAMAMDSNTKSLLGFAYDFDYPQTAAQVRAALGNVGDFTLGAGYLFNEAAGNASSVFGIPATLTASGSPTYSNIGARGGADKAFGFDSSTDRLDGGNNFDVGATADLLGIWVGRFTATPTAGGKTFFSKINAVPSTGWSLITAGADIYFDARGSSSGEAFLANAVITGEHHVGIFVIDRSTGKMRFALQGLATGTQKISAEAVAPANTFTTADSFMVGSSAWTGSVDTLQMSALYLVSGTGVGAGLSAGIATALANFAAYMKSQTGTQQARGVWFPDSPLNCDQHPSTAPDETDARGTESPTGVVLGLSGNVKYAHLNVRWDRCPVDRIREVSATYDNASLQVFFRDCIAGLGHSWFRALSPLQIYWSNAGTDTLLGTDGADFDGTGVAGWSPVSVPKFADIAVPSQPGWIGQFNVRFPRLVSSG